MENPSPQRTVADRPKRRVPDRAHPASHDLTDVQTEMYARELRGFFVRTLSLTRQLGATEERFQRALAEAVRAHDEEREWIALEVHDRIAQTLASVFQQLQAMEGLARSHPAIRRVAVRGSLLCRDAIREARNIMNDLRPPILEEAGLIPALEEELDRFSDEARCTVVRRFEPPVGNVQRPIEVTVYRIFREAIGNIRRHAGATLVEVSLVGDGAGIRLEVIDNGHGFDPVHAMTKKPVGGLLSMRRRAEVAGGTLCLESRPGEGTMVSAWLPLTLTAR